MGRRKRPRQRKEVKRPSQFVDWMNIWKIQSGHFTATCLKSFDGRCIQVGPYIYKLIRRLERIETRIELEHSVKDKSYLKILIDAIDKLDREFE